MARISAVVLARNEQANLPLALASLRGWTDEVVVVDGGSEDRTAAVARAAGARVLRRKATARVDDDRRLGVDSAAGDWLFFLDADEVVPPRLGAALRAAAEGGKADVVWVPEESWFLGARCDVWAKRAKPRLFRRGAADVGAAVHDFLRPRPDARHLRLPARHGRLVHYWVDGVDPLLGRLVRYTRDEAAARGPRRLGLLRLAFVWWGQLARSYLAHGGWRKGWRGLYLSLYQAMARATVWVRREEAAQGGAQAIRARYRAEAARVAGEPDGAGA
jgi:glycosyltransferase involved in cell wall biosynthesis